MKLIALFNLKAKVLLFLKTKGTITVQDVQMITKYNKDQSEAFLDFLTKKNYIEYIVVANPNYNPDVDSYLKVTMIACKITGEGLEYLESLVKRLKTTIITIIFSSIVGGLTTLLIQYLQTRR